VQLRKSWRHVPNKDNYVIFFKSVEDSAVPPNKKFVRAHTYVSGYYIEPVSENPLKVKLIIIAMNDIKGLIPKWLVNSMAAKAPKRWVENLKSGLEKIKRVKNNK